MPPRSPQPPDGPGRERTPPSWRGAPAFVPPVELPPHAPMPGAPPYPAQEEQPPAPVGAPAPRTGIGPVLAAAGVWAVVNLGLIVVVEGVPPSAAAVVRVLGVLIVVAVATALLLWAGLRRRAWPFWALLLAAAPCFFVLRALATLVF